MPKVTIDIGANDNASGVLNKVNASLKETKTTSEGSSSGLGSMAGAMAMGTVAAEGLMKGLEWLKEQTVDFAKESVLAFAGAEKMKLSLEIITGSVEDMKKVYEGMEDIKSPFQNSEMLASARTLLSMGESVEVLNGDMRMLADLAAGSQTPIQELAHIYGRMMSTGEVSTRELKRLAVSNIDVYGALGEVLGKTTGEIGVMVTEGKIGLKEMDGAFKELTGEGGAFYEAAQRQSETLDGKLINLDKSLHKLHVSVGADMEENAKRGVDAITSMSTEGGMYWDMMKAKGGLVNEVMGFFSDELAFVDLQYRMANGTVTDYSKAQEILNNRLADNTAEMKEMGWGLEWYYKIREEGIEKDKKALKQMEESTRVEREALVAKRSAEEKASLAAKKADLDKERTNAKAIEASRNARKEAEKYFDDVIYNSKMAQATEEERITVTEYKELEKINKLYEATAKSDEDYRKYTIAYEAEEEKAKSKKATLDIKRESDKLDTLSKIQAKFYTSSASEAANAWGSAGNAVIDATKDISKNYSDVLKKMEKDGGRTAMTFEEKFKLAGDAVSGILGAVGALLAAQSAIIQENAKAELDVLQQKNDAEIKSFDRSFTLAQDNADSQDLLNQEALDAYALTLQGMSDEDMAKAMNQKAIEMGAATNSKLITEAKAAGEKAINQKYAMDEYKVKLAAFKDKQSADKAQAEISMAIGIVNAWSSSMAYGLLGIGIATLLTGLMVGVGTKQIAMINAEKPPAPPAFATGVTNFEGGMALVGERGRELVNLPKGSNVITNENTESLLGGTTIVQNNIYLDSVLIHQSLVDSRRASQYGGY